MKTLKEKMKENETERRLIDKVIKELRAAKLEQQVINIWG